MRLKSIPGVKTVKKVVNRFNNYMKRPQAMTESERDLNLGQWKHPEGKEGFMKSLYKKKGWNYPKEGYRGTSTFKS